jgi:hypothetical protein
MIRVQELRDAGGKRGGSDPLFARDTPQIWILLHLSELARFNSIFAGQDISSRLVDGAAVDVDLFVSSSPPRIEQQRLPGWVVVLLSKHPSPVAECAVNLIAHIKNTREQFVGGSEVIVTRKKRPDIVPTHTDRLVGDAVPVLILEASTERVEEEATALAGDLALLTGRVADLDVLGSIMTASPARVAFAPFSWRGAFA